MKTFVFLPVLFLSAVGFANNIQIKVQAPESTQLKVTTGYQAKDKGLGCTRFVFEDFKRVPKIFDESISINSSNEKETLIETPLSISKCSAELISLPSIEVGLSGTSLPSDLDYKGSGISMEESQTSVTEVQTVTCSKFQSAKGLTTTCTPLSLKIGPDLIVNVQIVEK